MPKIQHVLDTYNDCQSVKEKHALLKTILQRIEYSKTTGRTLPAVRYADHALHALALICILTDNSQELKSWAT